MKEIKISIVIPVYNASKYLSKCLDSVINQSYSNIEIVLVDDGSRDNSGNICDEYSNKDKRIKVIHKENGGVSSARNTGIDNATGNYVTFIDSDDIIHPDYVKKLVANLTDNNLSVCHIEYFKNDVNFSSTFDETIELNKNEFINLCKMTLLNTPCCKLYNLDVIKKNKIYFDNSLSLGEDLLFNLEYLKFIEKITIINQKLYYYRKDDNNTLSTSYNPKMLEIQSLLFNKYTDFFNGDLNKEQLRIFDSYRFSTVRIIIENEFRNKKISFWERYINTRKLLNNDIMKDMIKKIRYPERRVFYFLIKNKLVLIYKVINKMISMI